jgi:hypothetical protein
MNMAYRHEATQPPTSELLSRVHGIFRAAGCRVR